MTRTVAKNRYINNMKVSQRLNAPRMIKVIYESSISILLYYIEAIKISKKLDILLC